jgi:hypothetical protein
MMIMVMVMVMGIIVPDDDSPIAGWIEGDWVFLNLWSCACAVWFLSDLNLADLLVRSWL